MRNILQNLVTGFGLVILLATPLCAQQPKSPAAAASSSSRDAKSRVWKSETTGKEYRVQMDPQRFYAEWVNVPPDQTQHKAYIREEAFASGSKYIGVSRSYLPCTVGGASGKKPGATRWCRLLTRIEFNSVTPDRIAGHGDTLKSFDCGACKILESDWKEFVWVPKR